MRGVVWRIAKRLPAIISVVAVAGCLSPCNSVVADVPSGGWHTPASVTVVNEDTLSARELYIVVRSNNQLTLDTLTVHVGVLSPDSLYYQEPFMIHIPRTPKAASVRRVTDAFYRSNVVLADSGEYRFVFRPTRAVQGIEAIGIRIVQ